LQQNDGTCCLENKAPYNRLSRSKITCEEVSTSHDADQPFLSINHGDPDEMFVLYQLNNFCCKRIPGAVTCAKSFLQKNRLIDRTVGQANAALLCPDLLNYLVLCAMRTSIGFPLTALVIFVTIVFTSAGTGPDGISSISKFIA